jgi:preprotein translocase subunit SecF
METKKLLLVAFLLTVGLLVMINGVMESFAVTFMVGLALALLGSIFWLNAE